MSGSRRGWSSRPYAWSRRGDSGPSPSPEREPDTLQFTYSLNNFDVEIRNSCFEEILTPWGAVAYMNLNRNAFLGLEDNQVCGARHLFAARLSAGPAPLDPPGGILAQDNVGDTTDDLFLVPPSIDFEKDGNAASATCVCP